MENCNKMDRQLNIDLPTKYLGKRKGGKLKINCKGKMWKLGKGKITSWRENKTASYFLCQAEK